MLVRSLLPIRERCSKLGRAIEIYSDGSSINANGVNMSTGITSGLGDAGFEEIPFEAVRDGEFNAADAGETIRQLNSFLRGEISAAETYRMAIDKVGGNDLPTESGVGLLREMQREHGRAAQAVRDRIRELGGEPSDSSGAWGAWAKFTEGVANLFGDTASLKALKEGEEHGLKDYVAGLTALDASSADLVQNQLIPAQRRHIDMLDQLIDAAARA